MTSFRIFEIILYSCLNLLPYLGLALYPFADKLRFSKVKVGLFIFLLLFFQTSLGIYATTCSQGQKGMLSLISTLCYGIFYFFVVKETPGKLIFVLLIVSNFANFIVICAKWMEAQIFPKMVFDNNSWSFSLCTFVAQIIFIPMLFIYFRKYIKEIATIETGRKVWRILWLIPATFYLFWYHGLYFNSQSTIALAMNPVNVVFTLFVNIGALLVYSVIVNAIIEFRDNLELRDEIRQLEVQNLCYENLKTQMESTRRARHDMRHHMNVIRTMAENNQCQEITQCLEKYLEATSWNEKFVYCGHFSLNALLVYYVQKAKNYGIDVNIDVIIPNELSISDTDLTVLFGNLLENAIDGCKTITIENKFINLKIKKPNEGALVFSIKNTFNGNVKLENGKFLSTKEQGSGIGIESVKYVVNKYKGAIEFKSDEETFSVSGVLFI